MDKKLRNLLVRNELLDLVNRYARALDRCDTAELSSLFFDDAQVEMISHVGLALDFVELTLAALREHAIVSSHLTSNSIFEIAGDRAIGESYLISWSATRGEGGPLPATHVGRYLDRFECRDGVWKFISRKVVIDLSLSGPVPDAVTAHLPDPDAHRHPLDAVYAEKAWLEASL